MVLERKVYPLLTRPIHEAVDFGFSWRDPMTGSIHNPPDKPTVRIFKLHGSVNWVRCQLCGFICINKDGPIFHQAFRQTSCTPVCCRVRRHRRLDMGDRDQPFHDARLLVTSNSEGYPSSDGLSVTSSRARLREKMRAKRIVISVRCCLPSNVAGRLSEPGSLAARTNELSRARLHSKLYGLTSVVSMRRWIATQRAYEVFHTFRHG